MAVLSQELQLRSHALAIYQVDKEALDKQVKAKIEYRPNKKPTEEPVNKLLHIKRDFIHVAFFVRLKEHWVKDHVSKLPHKIDWNRLETTAMTQQH
jgi:hypothetical protein